VVGHRTLEFIDPEDHPDAISSWMDMQRVPGSRRQQRRGGLSRSGEWQ
jgi:hypothetical protein